MVVFVTVDLELFTVLGAITEVGEPPVNCLVSWLFSICDDVRFAPVLEPGESINLLNICPGVKSPKFSTRF